MQSKLTGKPRLEKPSLKFFDDEKVQQKPSKEEANEWHHGLLAVGTLGNGDLKLDQQTNPPPSPNDHLHDFTPEEATHIQNELSSYLNQSNSAALLELEKAPNKFLSNQSSLKPEITSTDNVDCDELPKENMSPFQRSSSVVLSRGKDVCLDNTNSTIGKKSLSFLLKKVFVCSSGFAPAAAAPGLRDPVPESRMEKILRAILHKKIYPQSSSTSTMSMKKYLENSNPKSAKAKWDKTDSECRHLNMIKTWIKSLYRSRDISLLNHFYHFVAASNNTGFLSIAAKLIGWALQLAMWNAKCDIFGLCLIRT
ncbi:hypothetical protein ACFX2B_026445 [Malus domestica]